MRWTTERLLKRIKNYNRIYFNNEIEKPILVKWSRHLYNSDSSTQAHEQSLTDRHIITLSVSYSNASDEVMRSTLVHEMIHAWQNEHDSAMHDDWKEYEGHGPAFIRKCEELNSKFKFTYPLMRYSSASKRNTVKRLDTDVYFVYKMARSSVDASLKYPVGVFVKFLYRDEIVRLVNKGLSVKYYTNAKFGKTEYTSINGKFVTQTDVPITYTQIKNCDAANFIGYIADNCGWYHVMTDDDFNFVDGKEIDLS